MCWWSLTQFNEYFRASQGTTNYHYMLTKNPEQFLICFPGGAGGNWLSSLVRRLECNDIQRVDILMHNFHSAKKSRNIVLSHYPYSTILPKHQNLKKIIFTGSYHFNIYINVVCKTHVHDNFLKILKNDIQKKFIVFSNAFTFNEAWSKINYPKDKIDLNFDLIFDNPDQFTKDLYNVLDQNQIKYLKNDLLVSRSINQFRQSCPNPLIFFEDYNSPIWLAWALACIHTLGIKNTVNKNDLIHLYPEWTTELLKQELLVYKTQIKEFTMERIKTNFDVGITQLK